ncbi:MAG: hypothetical protein OXU83_06455 [Gammaproteobacteria bacterium]|nr:hypothetical protein [Gammaproteobacteria bacterium]
MEQQEQANAVQLPMTPEATSAVLAVRYAVDAEFRAEFDKDPKAALAKISGQELPSDLEIVVHRNEDKRWHLTLPAQETAGALDDEDIANVAGGMGGLTAALSLVAATPAICAAACQGIPPAAALAATVVGGVPGPMGIAAAGMAVATAAAAVQAGTAGGNDG